MSLGGQVAGEEQVVQCCDHAERLQDSTLVTFCNQYGRPFTRSSNVIGWAKYPGIMSLYEAIVRDSKSGDLAKEMEKQRRDEARNRRVLNSLKRFSLKFHKFRN